jgi:hypothetical protein
MIVHLNKYVYSRASNRRVPVNSRHRGLKEEDNVHRLFEDMEIGE